MRTDTGERVFIVLRESLAEMLVNITPETYKNCVAANKKRVPVIYVKLKKALCGMLRSSLLFYRKLRKKLEEYGFAVNLHNSHITNKIVIVEGDKL